MFSPFLCFNCKRLKFMISICHLDDNVPVYKKFHQNDGRCRTSCTFPFSFSKRTWSENFRTGYNYYLWIIWDLANRGSGRPWEAAALRLLFKPTLQHDCFEMICVTSGLKTYMSQCLYCFTISTHLSMNSWLLFFCTY